MPIRPIEELRPAWIPPVRVAAARPYTVYEIEDATDPNFDVCYQTLDEYFGALGQMEPREVMADLVARPRQVGGVWTACPMILVFHADGRVAGAGTRFFTFEPESGLLAGLDGNGWVAPSERSAGLGAALAPLLFGTGQRRLAPFGALGAREVVDLGDLEPFDSGDTDAVRRASFWGRLGFQVLPPEVFPLELVGMADATGSKTMLAMLQLPLAASPPAAVPKSLLHRLADHLAAAHAWAFTDGADLATPVLHRSIEAADDDSVPLRPLPRPPDR